jgi:hypothetical protein
VSREQGATADSYSYTTKFIRSVAPDGALSATYLDDYISSSSPLAYASSTHTADFDKLGRWLNNTSGSCAEAPNPPYYLVAPNAIRVDMSWQASGIVEGRCSLSPASQHSFGFKDKVFAMEQVTVPAGTFNALKVVQNGIEEDGNLRQASEQTCWWEPDLGIDVKCVTNLTVTSKATGETRTRVVTESMLGYSKQKLARKADTELRFLGNWTGHYDGVAQGQNVSGACTLTFDGGSITGSCTGPVMLNITGTVQADGSLAFWATNNGNFGSIFTGQFDSIDHMSGNWSAPNYGSGTFLLTQN